MISTEILQEDLRLEKMNSKPAENQEKIVKPEENKLAHNFKDSINVSGILDNCFFHSLALYYLANDISLPEDLFTELECEQSNPYLIHLKKYFKNINDLELFNQFILSKQEEDDYPNHLVEKSIILGIFLRSWFVEQLCKDQENRLALFEYEGKKKSLEEKQITFMSLIEDFQASRISDVKDPSLSKEFNYHDLYSEELDDFFIDENNLHLEVDTFKESVKDNPIYLANLEYFESLSGFDMEKVVHWSYWDAFGYLNYCNYLNEKVKISHSDVESVLRKFEIPFHFYSYTDSSLIREHNTDRLISPFELAIDVREGHYYLLPNEKTKSYLQEYKAQKKDYDEYRTIVLSTNDRNKIIQSHDSTALFLAATLPYETTQSPTLQLILDRVADMSEMLQSRKKHEKIHTNEPEVTKKSGAKKFDKKKNDSEITSIKTTGVISNEIVEPIPRNRESLISPKTKTVIRSEWVTKIVLKPNHDLSIFPRNKAKTKGHEIKPPVIEAEKLKISTNKRIHDSFALKASFLDYEKSMSESEFEHCEQIQSFESSLFALSLKVAEYQQKKANPPTDLTEPELLEYTEKYQRAENAADQLSKGLNALLEQYIDTRTESRVPYENFKTQSLKLINIHRPELAKHRDNDLLITKFIASIFGLGIVYGLVKSTLSGLRDFFWTTDGAEKVDHIIDALEEMPSPGS
ncbi:MAG: hypothetical protein H0U57_14740 [Tatlockia sp.]|nr:hypothetical protein [Tatlockia sp.]